MAKKADLEASFRDYSGRCAEALAAEREHDYPRMLAKAESTLPLVREAIAYLRRYQKVQAPRLVAVGQILRYAPPLFARRSLDAVDEWLTQASRPERIAYPELPEQVRSARRLMGLAMRIWPSWRAAAPNVAADDDPDTVTELVSFWVSYGAVARQTGTSPAMYQLVTHPQHRVRGKCECCGHTHEAKWVELLDAAVCPHCGATSRFVIVARAS